MRTMAYKGMVVALVLVAAIVGLWTDAEAQCTVTSLLDPPNSALTLEKVEGRWLVLMRAGVLGQTNYSDTLDLVPTENGVTLYSTGHLRNETSGCGYSALEMSSSPYPRLFTSAGGQEETLLLVARNPDLAALLLYLCQGQASGDQTCHQPTAILAGKPETAPQEAMDWLATLESHKACIGDSDPSEAIPQNSSEVCPLKTFWGLPRRDCNVANFPVQPNFNLTRYLGMWREVAWLAPVYVPPEDFYQDYIHTYDLLPNGSVSVSIEGRNPGTNECFFYDLILTTTGVAGKLILHESVHSAYNVISVDYDSYALVFGCNNVSQSTGHCQGGRGWLWSRDVTVRREIQLKVNSKLQDLCINPAAFLGPTTQNNRCKRATGGASGIGRETKQAAAILFASFIFLLMD